MLFQARDEEEARGCRLIKSDVRTHFNDCDCLVVLSQEICRLNTGHTAADHKDSDSGIYFAVKDINGIHYIGAIDSLEVNVQRCAAGRQDHCVRIDLGEKLWCDGRVKTDVHTFFLAVIQIGTKRCRDILLGGRDRGETELASDLSILLCEDNLVACSRCQEGSDQTGRTCACDQDFLGSGCFLDLYFALESRERIDEASDGSSSVEIAEAGLCAADAREDLLVLLCGNFGRQIRICDRFAAKRDEVRAAVQQCTLCDGGLITADGNDRNGDGFLDHFGRELVEAVRHSGRSAHIGERRIGHDRDIQRVYAAALCHASYHHGFLQSSAAVDLLIVAKAEEERIVVADFTADVLKDFLRELHAPEEIASELVGTLVGVGRHELRDQVSMCAVHFDAVCTRFFGTDCCVAELIDDFPHALIGHRLRDEIEHWTCYFRGRLRHLVEDVRRHTLPSGVMKLDDDFSAFLMDGVHKLFEAGNLGIIPQSHFVYDRLALAVDRRHFDDDQAEAALGSAPVIGDHIIRDLASVGGKVRSHRRNDKTVFEFHSTDLSR